MCHPIPANIGGIIFPSQGCRSVALAAGKQSLSRQLRTCNARGPSYPIPAPNVKRSQASRDRSARRYGCNPVGAELASARVGALSFHLPAVAAATRDLLLVPAAPKPWRRRVSVWFSTLFSPQLSQRGHPERSRGISLPQFALCSGGLQASIFVPIAAPIAPRKNSRCSPQKRV
jgi:hypothetical protein